MSYKKAEMTKTESLSLNLIQWVIAKITKNDSGYDSVFITQSLIRTFGVIKTTTGNQKKIMVTGLFSLVNIQETSITRLNETLNQPFEAAISFSGEPTKWCVELLKIKLPSLEKQFDYEYGKIGLSQTFEISMISKKLQLSL